MIPGMHSVLAARLGVGTVASDSIVVVFVVLFRAEDLAVR